MSTVRAIVFAVNPRALLAVAAIGVSVAYALFLGGAVSGLESAEEVLHSAVSEDSGIFQRPGLEPFRNEDAPPAARIMYAHVGGSPTLATIRGDWPYEENVAVPGPFARLDGPLRARGLDLPLAAPQFADGVPGDWVLIPSVHFDSLFPEMEGQATIAVGNGPQYVRAPAINEFYALGADQVTDSLAFVSLTSAFVATVVASVAVRLEVLSRRQDYALLEVLGGARHARRLLLARVLALVAAGLLLGWAAASSAFLYVNRSQDRLTAAASPEFLLGTLALVAIAATGGASWVGLRALRGALASKLSRRGTTARRFPGPVRFALVTPRVAPFVAVAVLVTLVAVGVVIGAAQAPRTLFDAGAGGTVLTSDTGNPLVGVVPRFGAEHADRFSDVGVLSPEIFVPTVVQGKPVLARGVTFDPWAEISHASLVGGRWPAKAGEAAAGTHLQSRLELQPGELLALPGSYRPVVQQVEVVGFFRAPGLEADELMVTLDEAASLARLDHDSVHLVRMAGATNVTQDLLDRPGVKVYDLQIEPDPPREGLDATAHVFLLNTASTSSSRALALRAGEMLLDSTTVVVPAFTSTEVNITFRVPAGPQLRLQVNPTLERAVVRASLTVSVPPIVVVEDGAEVQVFDSSGSLVAGSVVQTPWGSFVSDSGSRTIPVEDVGRFSIEAREGARFGGNSSFATHRAWLNASELEIERLNLVPVGPLNDTHASFHGSIRAINYGGVAYDESLTVRWGERTLQVPASVPPFSSAEITFTADAPFGLATVQVDGVEGSVTLSPDPDVVPAARTVDDIIRALKPARVETPEARTERFLEDVYKAMDVAVMLIILATIIHGGTVVWVAVRREAVERASVVETLRHIGASDANLRLVAARDAALSSIPGILLGLVLVPAVFFVAALADLPHAFGHRLSPDLDAEILLRVSAVFLAVSVLAAISALSPRPLNAASSARRPLRELVG